MDTVHKAALDQALYSAETVGNMIVGGLVVKPSRRDFIVEKAFGAVSDTQTVIQPLGRIEELKQSPLAKTPIYQGIVPSCVVCSVTFVNMWNSWKNEQHGVHLSWPFPYSQINHFENGTVPQEAIDFLRSFGQPLDEVMPQERFSNEPFFAEDPKSAPEDAFEKAKMFKTGPYLSFRKRNLESFYPFLRSAPILIGLYANSSLWDNAGENDVIPPLSSGFPHMVVLMDVDEERNFKVVSWGKSEELDIKTLHRDTPIQTALLFKDIPDGIPRESIRRGITLESFKDSLHRILWSFL